MVMRQQGTSVALRDGSTVLIYPNPARPQITVAIMPSPANTEGVAVASTTEARQIAEAILAMVRSAESQAAPA